MAEPIALLALGLDAAIGWPAALYRRIGHPVGAFARFIHALDTRWNRTGYHDATRQWLGVATVALLVGGTILLAIAAEALLALLPAPWSWIGLAALAWPALAQRSLYEHVRAVAQHLERGEREAARTAVAQIVGRDVASLDEAGIARAAIESLAESFCDALAAPLFWLVLGGLPGVWAYKAINTADSLIGHREEPYRRFGWAAARLDDVVNLIPARLAALLLCAVAGRGLRILLRDAHRHASPNAGWTEAAMAGALDLRLAGPVCYDGVWHAKEWIGAGRAEASAQDIARALRIYTRACLILWIIAGGIAWAL
ncbi:adenosylcobinamide-phosphate synthase CbiB [Novosphingobium sp. 1949]|uniref:Cobalamin biosynthesis protein CobD n=1 Tax=Novosphingobium organovorum TaxID=2930092 RepID=A0ABT0BG21_9SPHN|nr:adenosylcobinamide-phosphate synthase CbiB [Novosphingobium organovorum]MCJ2183971.1 adenosylcobinamide-phosphate synthase CbiB [Novosphingobium organovorum]